MIYIYIMAYTYCDVYIHIIYVYIIFKDLF